MIPLDISGASLFSNSSQFLHVVGIVLKLIAGSFGIILFTGVSIVAAVVYSVYKAAQNSSAIFGLRLLLRSVAYLTGVFFALLFIMVAAIFFSISFLKLLLVAALIGFISSFLVQEFILFFLFKRFGKYFFYITSLRQIHKTVFNDHEEKN